MKMRITCILLALVMVFVFTPVFASNQPSTWAVDDVEWAILLGLVPEKLQSQYTQPITRAEFAALVITFYEEWYGEVAGRLFFSDTSDVYVQKAAYLGIVTGVGNNVFAPNSLITREQSAVMLSRLIFAFGGQLPNNTASFSDNGDISYWAISYVGQIQGVGIIGGVGGNLFQPNGQFTREQGIVTMLRVLDYLLNTL